METAPPSLASSPDRCVVSFTPLLFHYWGKNPWHQLKRRLHGPNSQSRWPTDEKNLELPGIKSASFKPEPTAIPSEIFCLLNKRRDKFTLKNGNCYIFIAVLFMHM
jgi:hypothetical protein